MARDARAYLEQHVISLIADKHPRVAAEMSVVITGSYGLGVADELADLDAIIYLEDDLWDREGGHVQLLLWRHTEPFRAEAQRYCDFPGHPEGWVVYGHPEVGVHPASWLLDGQAGHILGGADVPWEEISPEGLFKLRHDSLVVRDPRGMMRTLREATRPEHLYPARDREAWSNPEWLEQIRAEERKAQGAGYEAGDRWIWSLWDSV